MPPIRRSSRNQKAVIPYQAADGPKLTLQQLRRRRARYRQATEDRKKEAQKEAKEEQELEKQVLLSIIRKMKEEENNKETTEIPTTENELTVVLSVPGVSQKMKLTYIVDSAYSSQNINEIAKKTIRN